MISILCGALGQRERERVHKTGFMTCALYSWLSSFWTNSQTGRRVLVFKELQWPDSSTTKRTTDTVCTDKGTESVTLELLLYYKNKRVQ